jgi:hypothetical protein
MSDRLLPTQPPEEPPPPPPGEHKALPPAPHADRFRFVLGALLGLGLAAIVAAVALFVQGPSANSDWSSWRPTADGQSGAAQIAAHVSTTYRAPDGSQLVAVKAGPMKIADLDLNVAVKAAKGDQVFSGSGVRYVMCGLGPNCSIADGKRRSAQGPAPARGARTRPLQLPVPVQHRPVVAFYAARARTDRARRSSSRGRRRVGARPAAGRTLPSPPPSFSRAGRRRRGRPLRRPPRRCFAYQVAQDVSAYLVLSAPHHLPGHGRQQAGPEQPAVAAALQRSKARLDAQRLYPRAVRLRFVRVWVTPWLFRLPWFALRRLRVGLDLPAPAARRGDERAALHGSATSGRCSTTRCACRSLRPARLCPQPTSSGRGAASQPRLARPRAAAGNAGSRIGLRAAAERRSNRACAHDLLVAAGVAGRRRWTL